VTRVLVYGFGPYQQFKDNVTSRIVKKLRASRGLKKIVFPVKFDKRQFTGAVRKHRPGVVLGLGQCSTGSRLRIERQALNGRRARRQQKRRPILPGGPKKRPTNLRLSSAALGGAELSGSPGDYVCNFSMYVILDYLERHGCKAEFGFIHIPHDYPLAKAARSVRKVLREIARG
jgi:pyroglutamyl-peptidase